MRPTNDAMTASASFPLDSFDEQFDTLHQRFTSIIKPPISSLWYNAELRHASS
jgi:hypothetical protein